MSLFEFISQKSGEPYLQYGKPKNDLEILIDEINKTLGNTKKTLEYNKISNDIQAIIEKIQTISWKDYKDIRTQLRSISTKSRKINLCPEQRQKLWDMTSNGFSLLDKFKDLHFKTVEEDYQAYHHKIQAWKNELDSGRPQERKTCWDKTHKLKSGIFDSNLDGKRKYQLKELIDECYTRLKSETMKDLFREYDLKIYLDSFKYLYKQNLSEIKLPDIEVLHNNHKNPLPPNTDKISLDDLLDIYPQVFSFDKKNSKKKNEFRPEQIQYALMCYEGITTKRDVIIEGPTGLGKTRALICSILPFLKKDKKRRVIYTTRTAAQVHSVIEDLREVLPIVNENQQGDSLDATLFLGTKRVREEIAHCFEENSLIKRSQENVSRKYKKEVKQDEDCQLCEHRLERFDPPSTQQIKRLNKSPEFPQIIGYSELKTAKKIKMCPMQIYQDKAKDARIVVMPHSYLYDSAWMDKYFPDKENTALIIDEAHNFVTDAGNNAFLRIGLEYYTDEDDKPVSGENRQTNTFYINNMLKRLAKDLSDTRNSLEISNLEIRDVFPYLITLHNEIYSAANKIKSDKNIISE
ncbi:MAG: DEAD/DEAH box helicase family protein [Nanoarchaeota archaeon]|nr:DEAD/DEAH box helicase family protein [Nanoarchaeota archaeon]